MPDLATELTTFMTAYEQANNSHDINLVAPMIARDATYWFTDGSYQGLPKITAAITQAFSAIQDETYKITNLEWIVLTAEHTVCRYWFSWKGVVAGRPSSGHGRGTNIIVKHEGQWKMQHEHLST